VKGCVLEQIMTKLHQRMVPSLEVGEYSRYQETSKEYLFPLQEEGHYGPLPVYKTQGKWTPLPKYERREKKPKVYASYAVSSDCGVHGHKIGSYKKNCDSRPSSRASSRRSLSVPPRAVSVPPKLEVLQTPQYKTEVRERTLRQLSAPPLMGTKESYALEDMIGKLKVSITIKQDIEGSLLDKTTEFEEYHEPQPDNIKHDRGLSLKARTCMQDLQEQQERTFMHSTGSFLNEQPITTYVI